MSRTEQSHQPRIFAPGSTFTRPLSKSNIAPTSRSTNTPSSSTKQSGLGWDKTRETHTYSPKNHARFVVMMLEVLAFSLDTNDVVNSLEMIERKIKEFERHANIEIWEFLKIGIVIRQAEDR